MTSIFARLGALVGRRRLAESPVPVALGADDAETERYEFEPEEVVPDGAAAPADAGLGPLEGQTFAIEYVNANGERSLRRISVWAASGGGDGVVYLEARCHERKAMRAFRSDRIVCCIDLDGEVHDDVAGYLYERLGVDVAAVPAPVERGSDMEPVAASARPALRGRGVDAAIRPDATLYAAMIASDGVERPAEVDIAVDACLARLSPSSVYATGEGRRRLAKYILGLRPDAAALERACADIRGRDADDVVAVLTTAARIMDADGIRHPDEKDLLNGLAVELTGVEII